MLNLRYILDYQVCKYHRIFFNLKLTPVFVRENLQEKGSTQNIQQHNQQIANLLRHDFPQRYLVPVKARLKCFYTLSIPISFQFILLIILLPKFIQFCKNKTNFCIIHLWNWLWYNSSTMFIRILKKRIMFDVLNLLTP